MKVSLSQIVENIKNGLSDYFKIGLGDYYISSAHRWLVYAMVFILVGLFTFIGLSVFDIIDPLTEIPLSFKGMHAWHTAINYALCLAIVDIVTLLMFKSWGAYDKRSVGRAWILFLLAGMVAYIFQRTLVYELVVLYSPVILWIYEMNPTQRPGPIPMFLFILPFWLVIGTITMRVMMSKQAQAQELFRVRIDAILEDRQRPAKSIPASEQNPVQSATPHGNGYIPLPPGAGIPPIPIKQVGHISAEDHYLRIYYQSDEDLKNVLVRMPLKALSSHMPEDQFVQVHRSHIVNLEHVSRLKRSGRSARVAMKHGEFELPVSRYRYPEILPKLEKYLHPD